MATRWLACSGPATSCCRSSSGSSPPTSTSAATRSPCRAGPGRPKLVGQALRRAARTAAQGGRAVPGRGRAHGRHAARAEGRRAGRPPGRRAHPGHPLVPRPDDPAQDAEPEALRRRDRQAHDRVRDRPGRHRQDLPGDGQGGRGAAGQGGQPDHPDPARGRGGRAARLPARHPLREDRPVPAPALRRPARHGRPRLDPEADGGGHDRDRAAGVHARPLAERLVHHPRRGPEHHAASR